MTIDKPLFMPAAIDTGAHEQMLKDAWPAPPEKVSRSSDVRLSSSSGPDLICIPDPIVAGAGGLGGVTSDGLPPGTLECSKPKPPSPPSTREMIA